MEHIDEMLIDTDDMLRQQALFGLVFEEFPTYNQILSGTPKLSPVFATKKTHRVDGPFLVTPKTLFSNLMLGGQELYFILEEWSKPVMDEPEPEPMQEHELVLIL